MGDEWVTTRRAGAADATAETIARLTDLVNEVYAVAEAGMWQPSATRTDAAEVERLLRAGSLIVAELDGELVGVVKTELMGDGVGEFGILVADPKQRGKGLGTALVAAAEQWARDAGCHTMRLELLAPRGWSHPGKEFLREWYTRIGYVPQRTEPFEAGYAHLVPRLATPCDFTIWHKPLR